MPGIRTHNSGQSSPEKNVGTKHCCIVTSRMRWSEIVRYHNIDRVELTEHTIGQALSILDDTSVGVIEHVRFTEAFRSRDT